MINLRLQYTIMLSLVGVSSLGMCRIGGPNEKFGAGAWLGAAKICGCQSSRLHFEPGSFVPEDHSAFSL